MLLRSVALLLLCASLGLCATLVYHQSEAKQEPDTQAEDSSEVNSFFRNKLLGKIPSSDNKEEGVQEKTEVLEEQKASAAGGAAAIEETNEIRQDQTTNRAAVREEENNWSINSIRNSFQTVHGYFDTLVELVGGHNGVCQYRCRYGELPRPRPGYQQPEPNGCNSSLMGFQFDVGIPAMTKCCNQLDACYDTCGVNKYECDDKLRVCLHAICSDLKKSLGFVSKVQACESMADALYNTVWTLGCRPYMNSQRSACLCEGEERDEL